MLRSISLLTLDSMILEYMFPTIESEGYLMVAVFCAVNFLVQQDYQCNFPVMWNTLTKLGSKCLKRFSIFLPKSSQDSFFSCLSLSLLRCSIRTLDNQLNLWFKYFFHKLFLFLCISLLHQLVFFLNIPTLDFLHTLVDVFKSIVLKILLLLSFTSLSFS